MAKAMAVKQQSLADFGEAGRAQDFIKLEKNLNYISFFSPSKSKRGKSNPQAAPRVRTITYPPREIDGKIVHPRTTIKPDAQLGLPTTADRDKYMAFMKIVTDRKAKLGQVQNPIGFTTYELLKGLGLTDAGFHYEEVNQFLERMVSTTIKSEYAVYFHNTKRFAKDIFHVFNRVVLTGQEMADGTVAQMNYVFLSDWQLENINTNYTFPIDFNSYRQLKRDIAKALFGHLHTWFYASRGKPVEKKYSELCELLDIQRWPHISKAKQILQPPLDELIRIRYFQSWDLVHTVDGTDFKLIMSPGEAILRVTRPRLSAANPVQDPAMEEVVRALVERGVRESDARRALFDIDLERQQVRDQIECFDDQARRMGSSMTNPPGFLLAMIRENWPVPPGFETTRKKQLRVRAMQEREQSAALAAPAQQELRRIEIEEQYRLWVDARVDQAIAGRFTAAERARRLRACRKEILEKYPGVYTKAVEGAGTSPALEEHAERLLREEVKLDLSLPSLEEFTRRPQGNLF
jgi:hypothetical protein